MRDLLKLPKAHLHLHFTGSMRHATLLELAARDGISLPDQLVEEWPPTLSAADEKGWFRFQRLYDVARSVLRTEDDVRRLVREAAEDDVRDGGRWLEIQVDPSGYGVLFGGIAANRTRHPLDARTLARLAGQYAGRGVVGFGLSNDERRGSTADFASAFRIAERAGLLLAPHGGELRGPEHIRVCLDSLGADRLGHGVRAAEDPALFDRIFRHQFGQPTPGSSYGHPAQPPQQPPYGYNQPYPYQAPRPKHPSAMTAMVLGIIGLVGIVTCGGLTLVLSPFAWVIGGRAVKEIDAAPPGTVGGRDEANAGRIMGIIGTILLILGILALIAIIALVVALPS